jgi:hypothetical protein
MSEEERKATKHMEEKEDNYTWIRWILAWIRWTLVLPVSIIFYCWLNFSVTLVSVFLGHAFWDLSGFLKLFQTLVVLIACPLLSVLIGVSIAPRHKFITATCLAILYISFGGILMVGNLTNTFGIESADLSVVVLYMLPFLNTPSKLIFVYLIGILVLIACCFCIKRIKAER